MNATPKFHETLPLGTPEYQHWYSRHDKNGNVTRPPGATPGNLFETVFKLLAGIEEQFIDPPDVRRAFTDGGNPSDAMQRNGPIKNFPIPFPLNKSPFEDGDLPSLSDVDLIVGVIDTDIPLGHRAFRQKGGKTRVLYHWDMGGGPAAKENELFGKEFTQKKINKILKRSSGGNINGSLDADAFNRTIGAVNMGKLAATRGLMTRYAHGAHMLDVAGGAEPTSKDGREFSKKVGLVTIAMPSRWEFGEGGEFLDAFMLFAVLRLYFVIGHLREAHKATVATEERQLPCVTSLAFGRQAGIKRDQRNFLALVLGALSADTQCEAPFELVMPVGNDNLDRVAAQFELEKDVPKTIDWVIQPGDQSDNYLEIWAESTSDAEAKLAIELIPNGEASKFEAALPNPGEYWDVYAEDKCCNNGNECFGARVYRLKPLTSGEADIPAVTGYLCATGATNPRNAGLATVPPGRWKIVLRNMGDETITVDLSVQTDQSVTPVSGVSGRSYLEDECYRVRDAAGRLIDSVRFDGKDWVGTDKASGVRRRGTINAASSQNIAAVVGGYRASDGNPAPYSASGDDVPCGYGREAPTALMPTDDTPVLGGTLAAGSTDGSYVAMRGTSFAASKATRLVAETWLNNKDGPKQSAKAIVGDAAKCNEADQKNGFRHPFDAENPGDAEYKFGFGRAVGPSYLQRTSAGKVISG